MRTLGVALAFLALPVSACSSGGSGPEKDAGDEWSAQAVCEEFVKDRLKSPSTADFSDENREQLTDTVFVVTGSVDSENGFGAMIRNDFTCRVRYAGGDNWRLVRLGGLTN